ncbi:TPA: hypothetical protein ACP2OC_003599 [Escherichia coli]
MTKLNYLKPVASVLISAVIATAGSVYITSKYLKPDVPGNDEIGRVAASYLVKNPQYLLEAGKALEKENTKEGANKRGNSSRLTQPFHFFMFEPIFSPVNALNQPI